MQGRSQDFLEESTDYWEVWDGGVANLFFSQIFLKTALKGWKLAREMSAGQKFYYVDPPLS